MASLRLSLICALPAALLALLITSFPFLGFLLNEPDALGKESALYLFQHCRDICFVLLLFIGFYSLGKRILRFFKFSEGNFNGMEKFLYSSLLGEAAVGYLLLFLGLSWLFQKKSFALVYFLLFFGSLPEIKKIPALFISFKNLLMQKCSLASFVLAFLLVISLLRGFIASGAPPVNWDSLAYHLAFPKLFLEQEKIFRIPWSINAHYPLHTEMIYTLALSLCHDLAAHWVNFMHGLFFLLAVFTLAKRFFSDFAAKAALAILAVQPVFQRVFGNAATDLPVAFVSTMTFHSWINAINQEDEKTTRRHFFLCGALCGIAASYKLTGCWLFFSLFLLTALTKNFPNRWLRLCFLSFAFALFASPWYLKNLVWTGNPIWPYLGEYFGANSEDIHTWTRMKESLTEGVEKKFLNWLLLPGKIVFEPELFRHQPHYLAFPFLLFFVARIFRKLKMSSLELKILFFIIIFGSIWFWTHQEWRYMLPAAALGAILIAFWFKQLIALDLLGKAIACGAIFAFFPVINFSVNNELFAFFGVKSKVAPELTPRERYLEYVLGDSYRLMRISNQILPESAKVLFFGEVRGYYFDRAYAWGDPLNPGVFSYAKIESAEELHKILLQQKFTHIFYNPLIGNYKGDQTYYTRANRWMREVLKNHAKLVANSGPVALFQISTKSKVP